MYGIVKSIVFFTLSSHSHTFPFQKIGKGKSCPGREKIEVKKIIENNTKRQLNIKDNYLSFSFPFSKQKNQQGR
ncbi:hypothetical protein BO85DRAFT_24003 [Aspergillus piperis CBS 112811]|uniref:Uncharacterized protein n=1 Tax=Aspergillus piperis CBS 112811 TaxID=1448313 RepID=A0A8G1RC29_9EURO|nr:hypothetical protein BO85DRAFT_24003 [Aspergillus piperis CBS 112811]RAH63444.1 hypothetical protein BO85DRAFT_24003 [Aspergillus piperis CBS 112811]